MSYKKKIKLNVPLKDFDAGHVLDIDTDKDGTPLSRYWRDRLKDAQEDRCVEFVTEKETKRSKK